VVTPNVEKYAFYVVVFWVFAFVDEFADFAVKAFFFLGLDGLVRL